MYELGVCGDLHACMVAYVYIHMYIYTYIHVLQMLDGMSLCHTQEYMYIYICIYIYIHIYIHTYIHICMHASMNVMYVCTTRTHAHIRQTSCR